MPKPTAMTDFASRFSRLAAAAISLALASTAARAQTTTTLGASYTTTAMQSSAALSTGSGLTINLGLGFEYLIVGGGGGGGGNIGGGGGAGGLLTNVGGTAPVAVLSGGTAVVAVGGGGTGGTTNARGSNGANSSIFNQTANGGGGGGVYDAFANPQGQAGLSGGSGGGGSPSNLTEIASGGGRTVGQGNVGGSGQRVGGTGNYQAGGGGGAGAAGTSANQSVIGNGGNGVNSSITGSAVTYAGGGGGGATNGGTGGTGGSGGGGAAGRGPTAASGASGVGTGGAGTNGLGGGGGGGGYENGFNNANGGAGGSGVVIVRYRSATSLTSGGDTADGYTDGSGDWRFERFTTVGSRTLTVNAFDAANLLAAQTGVISGTGSLTFNSPGTLALTAANTYTGPTTVSAGTLSLGSGGTVGSISASSAIAIASGAAFAVNRSNAITLSNAISGNGAVAKRGTGTLTLSGGNSHAGGTRLEGGTLLVGSDNALGSGPVVFAVAGATLETTRNITNPITMNASGTLAAGSSTIALSGNLTGTGMLTKTGSGTLTLSGNNTFSGGLTFGTGTVKVGSNTALGSGTITANGTGDSAGGSLDLDGATVANAIVIAFSNTGMSGFGALQNTNTSTAAVLNGPVQIGGANYVGRDGDIILNGVVSGGLSTNYSLFKQGAGTWTFANEANTFDGFYYQIGGVTEVTKLANAGQASSLGQVSAGQNLFVFGFGGSGGGTLRYAGSAASTSDRAFSLRGSTAAADNTIEAAGTSAAATLTLTGGLSAGVSGSYTARLAGANAGVNEYAGVIANGSGTVGLEKTGSTTWVLTGANSYSGATTVSAGTLKAGNGGTTGSLGSGSVTNNARLIFDRTNSLTVANAISGTGTLEQAGTGITLLTGNNSFSGPTLVSSGTLSVGSGGSAGTLGTSSVSIAAGATLAVNRSDAFTLGNTLGGSGRLLKQGANVLTLTGTSTYSGGTRLEGGTLVVGSDGALGTGTLSFSTAGATLQTARNVLVPIDVATSGALAIVGSGVDLTAPFSGAGTLTKTGTGTLTLSGSGSTFTGTLVIAGGAGANSIVRAGNTAAFGTGTVTILGGGGNTGSTFDLNGQSLDNALVIGLGNSGVGDTGALQNSNAASPAVLNGSVSLGGEIYVGGAGDIRFNGLVSGGVNPANAYSLYKDGAGTWSFTNTANTFDGFYYQVDGATEVASLANLNQPSALGQPTDANRNRFVFGIGGNGGGTLRFNGSAASTSDRVFALQGSTSAERNTIEAAGTSAAATLTLTGGLSASRAGSYTARLAGDNAGVNEYAGVIANGSGTVGLEKTGSTTWVLTGANTYSGATTVSAGTLKVGNGGTAGVLGGSGGITNDGVLAYNRSDAVTLSRSITGSGAFHQLGSGTTTLTGANSYAGGTVVSAGRLVGDAASLQGAIANDAAVEFAQATSGTYSGSMNGLGSFTKSGIGSLTLTGSNTFTGGSMLDAGTLVLANAQALGSSTVLTMQPGTTLTVNQRTYVGDIDQFGGTINGTGELISTLVRTQSGSIAAVIADADGGIARGIRKLGSGTTTVTSANTFTGSTRVEDGTLALGTGGSFAAASSLELFLGGTLDLAGASQTFSAVSGTAGTVALGAGTLTVNAAAQNTFGGAITGSGGFVKSAAGNLILSGTNTYTGPTSVAEGRLSVNGVLGDSPVAVLADAELGGSGSIVGPVSIASGGRLAPGNSIESLSSGTTTFAGGATFAYEVDSSLLGNLGVAADLLRVNGDLNLSTDVNNRSLLSFTDLAGMSAQPFVEDTTVFAMINYTGNWNGGLFSFGGQTLADGSRFSVGSQLWEIDYDYQIGGGNIQPLNFTADQNTAGSFVAITAVPEPSTLVLACLGGVLACWAARRRRT